MTIFQNTTHKIAPITVAAKLGSGGEGTVYAVEGNPDICVKIYHEQKRTPELEAKLKAMIDAPPKDPTLAAGHYSICWPTNVVYEDEACTKFLGFIMPRIDRNVFKEYHLLCDKPGVTTSTCYRLEHFGTGFTYLHMYVVALNLASCVASIHAAGHAIGDLNDKNILVSTKDSKITIVDCDSFEIHAKDNKIFPCSVYMPEYSAPEVIQRKEIKNRQESDRFALSILIFKLLMLNTHPYASRGSSVEHLNTPGEKIMSGYYPYEEYTDLDVNPPAYALPYDIIPPNIKALFRRCFVEGQHEPEKRPSAMEWFIAIKENYEAMTAKVHNKLVMCGNNARHFFPTHLTTCPWCAMKEDYFPIQYNKKAQTQPQFDYREAFSYIDNLLEYYGFDYSINYDEYTSLKKKAAEKNIPLQVIDTRIKRLSQIRKDIRIGNDPDFKNIINRKYVFEKNSPITQTFTFSIHNRFIYEALEVTIESLPNWIEVTPLKAIITPNTEQKFTVFVHKEKIGTPLFFYNSTFTISTATNIYKNRKFLKVTAFVENREEKLIKKEKMFQQWSLYLPIFLAINLLVFFVISFNNPRLVIISLYIIVNLVAFINNENHFAERLKPLILIPSLWVMFAFSINEKRPFIELFEKNKLLFFGFLTFFQVVNVYVKKGTVEDIAAYRKHIVYLFFIVFLGLILYFATLFF